MKKIIFFAALVAAVASCQKPDLTITEKEKKAAVLLPESDQNQSETNSQEFARCANPNPNAQLQYTFTIEPTADPVETFDANGNLVKTKYQYICTFVANKKLFLPGEFDLLPSYTYGIPPYAPAKFSIQYAVANEQGFYVTGDGLGAGNLDTGAYRASTVCVSGVARRDIHNPKSEMVFKPNMKGTFLINIVITEAPGVVDAEDVIGQYLTNLLHIPAKENLNDPYTLWKEVLPAGNTVVQLQHDPFGTNL